MNWKHKTAIAFYIILTLFIMAFVIKNQYETIEKQNAIHNDIVEMKKLKGGLVRSEASYSTSKDLEKTIKETGISLDVIKKDLKRLKAELKAVNITSVVTPGYYGNNLPSTSTTPGNSRQPIIDCSEQNGEVTCPDLFGYMANRQELELVEPFSDGSTVPWGEAGFSSWQKDPWDLNIHPRKYLSTTVISTDIEGRTLTHNRVTIEVDGKTYVLPITASKLVEEYPESEFRWNPRLYLSLEAGSVFTPPVHFEGMTSLQLSLFSYGRTKLENDWTFLNLGLGYLFQEESVGAIITPISYNVGKPLPLVDNLHIGPSAVLDFSGNFALMFGLRVGL